MSFLRVVPVLALVVTLVVASAQSGGPAWMSPSGNRAAVITAPAECDVLNVIDGDTVDFVCRGHGEVRARLTGYDAPEIFDSRCAEERRLGRAAAQHLREALGQAGQVVAHFDGTDRYGRHLVQLQLDGNDIAERLVAEGLARPYNGGPRADWCDHSG